MLAADLASHVALMRMPLCTGARAMEAAGASLTVTVVPGSRCSGSSCSGGEGRWGGCSEGSGGSAALAQR